MLSYNFLLSFILVIQQLEPWIFKHKVTILRGRNRPSPGQRPDHLGQNYTNQFVLLNKPQRCLRARYWLAFNFILLPIIFIFSWVINIFLAIEIAIMKWEGSHNSGQTLPNPHTAANTLIRAGPVPSNPWLVKDFQAPRPSTPLSGTLEWAGCLKRRVDASWVPGLTVLSTSEQQAI